MKGEPAIVSSFKDIPEGLDGLAQLVAKLPHSHDHGHLSGAQNRITIDLRTVSTTRSLRAVKGVLNAATDADSVVVHVGSGSKHQRRSYAADGHGEATQPNIGLRKK
jgi:hypothetical protein